MRKRKKEIVEDDNERLMNFSKEKFLSLLRDRLVVDEELVSDEELLSEDMRGSLGVDSLDYVETIMDVECAIGRRISYEDVEKIKCFQDLWGYVHECQQNPQKLQ